MRSWLVVHIRSSFTLIHALGLESLVQFCKKVWWRCEGGLRYDMQRGTKVKGIPDALYTVLELVPRVSTCPSRWHC